MSEDKDHSIKCVKFYGNHDDWLEWRDQTMALSRRRGIAYMFTQENQIPTELEFSAGGFTPEAEKLYKDNGEAFDLLMLSCRKITNGLVRQGKGNAFAAFQTLRKKFEPKNTAAMREIQSEVLSCKLKNAREYPDSWFVRL